MSPLPPPINHIFVDFENVRAIDLSVIGSKAVDFTLLLGAKCSKLEVGLVEKMLEHAASVQLVRLGASGKNALDFTLAFYLGKAVTADPTGFFHIVSKDKGFDPLVEHLRSRHVKVRRHDDFSALSFSAPSNSNGQTAAQTSRPHDGQQDDLFTRFREHLGKNKNNRPKRKKTLLSHLLALAGGSATESCVQEAISKLEKAGHIKIGEKGEVTYLA